MLPQGAIGKFLFSLTENADDEHYRWEPIDQRQPVIGRTKGAKGISMRARRQLAKRLAEDPGAAPVLVSNQGVIYLARKRSIRCRYMIFNFPKKFRKDQIYSLYKALIVHDLVEYYNMTKHAIAKSVEEKQISNYSTIRCTTIWERMSGRIFEKCPVIEREINYESGFSDEFHSFEAYLSQKMFTSIESPKSHVGAKINSPEFNHINNIRKEITRYLDRSRKLSKLAPTGHFKDFPSILPK